MTSLIKIYLTYLVLNFVDGTSNGSSQVLHTNVNVFHSVVCVWIVENKSFLDFLVMVGELLDLWSVALDRSLKVWYFLGFLSEKLPGKS